jgi:predicted alpha/beta-hydrolase family hydrolase
MLLFTHSQSMVAEGFAFEVAGSKTTALYYGAEHGPEGARAAIVLAHGAGAPQTHPWMVQMASALAARGLEVVTFNFLYTAAKRRVPDKTPVLEATWRAAVVAARARSAAARRRLFIGGKSMGGRMATHVAAEPGAIEGLAGVVLLGYPLHPPGQPEKLRAAHLARVEAPMLFVQGTRDTFGTPAELEPFVAPLAARGTRLFAVEGGDHSLAPLKSSGVTAAQAMARVADEIARFTA